jgi:hypothetical protein
MKRSPLEIAVCVISIVLSVIAIILVSIKLIVINNRKYQYEDYNGDIGYSINCYRKKSWLYCEDNDGKLVDVVRFFTVDGETW